MNRKFCFIVLGLFFTSCSPRLDRTSEVESVASFVTGADLPIAAEYGIFPAFTQVYLNKSINVQGGVGSLSFGVSCPVGNEQFPNKEDYDAGKYFPPLKLTRGLSLTIIQVQLDRQLNLTKYMQVFRTVQINPIIGRVAAL